MSPVEQRRSSAESLLQLPGKLREAVVIGQRVEGFLIGKLQASHSTSPWVATACDCSIGCGVWQGRPWDDTHWRGRLPDRKDGRRARVTGIEPAHSGGTGR